MAGSAGEGAANGNDDDNDNNNGDDNDSNDDDDGNGDSDGRILGDSGGAAAVADRRALSVRSAPRVFPHACTYQDYLRK